MSELNVELSKYAAPGFGLGEPWSQGGITGDRVRSLAAGPGLCACTEGTGPLECGVADLLDRVSRRKEEFATAEPEPEAHPMGEVAWSGGDARLGGGVAGGARDQGNGRSVQLRSLAANGLSSSGRSHGGGAAARKDLNSTRRTQEVQALQAEVAMQEVQLRRLLSTRPGEEISDEVAFQAATLWQGLERIRGVIGGLLERVGDPAGSEPEAAAPSAAPAGAAASASARHVVHSGSSACSGQRSARVSYVNRAQAAPQQQPQQQQQKPRSAPLTPGSDRGGGGGRPGAFRGLLRGSGSGGGALTAAALSGTSQLGCRAAGSSGGSGAPAESASSVAAGQSRASAGDRGAGKEGRPGSPPGESAASSDAGRSRVASSPPRSGRAPLRRPQSAARGSDGGRTPGSRSPPRVRSPARFQSLVRGGSPAREGVRDEAAAASEGASVRLASNPK
eukprot:TRINITY_DN5070_c1_g2_i2.p1 TRINITY_DN5070_c1_g2~~TRINITY_DN5070_c1_g2_i2.p1  ORF type:complete len:449 (-),score=97.02 TRINITY_DN5070_c1_g2_i2:27-1373(-)